MKRRSKDNKYQNLATYVKFALQPFAWWQNPDDGSKSELQVSSINSTVFNFLLCHYNDLTDSQKSCPFTFKTSKG